MRATVKWDRQEVRDPGQSWGWREGRIWVKWRKGRGHDPPESGNMDGRVHAASLRPLIHLDHRGPIGGGGKLRGYDGLAEEAKGLKRQVTEIPQRPRDCQSVASAGRGTPLRLLSIYLPCSFSDQYLLFTWYDRLDYSNTDRSEVDQSRSTVYIFPGFSRVLVESPAI